MNQPITTSIEIAYGLRFFILNLDMPNLFHK
jgi:hypothetical protein